MKLPLYVAASALAIFATSCSKEKITPNGSVTSAPNTDNLNTNGDVVVFDPSGPQSIGYQPQSDDSGVLTNSSNDIGSSAQEQEFDPAGENGTSTGVILGTTQASENTGLGTP
jgi:hypothetical protein